MSDVTTVKVTFRSAVFPALSVAVQVIGETPCVSFGFEDACGGWDAPALVERLLEEEDVQPFDLLQPPRPPS